MIGTLATFVDQTRFEVNVSMPAFFQDTDTYIKGSVMAK